MPFIDNNFKITNAIRAKKILITTADYSPIYQETEKLARFLQGQNERILCIDGDLGNGIKENPNLSQVLRDKGAISKAVKTIHRLSVLGGKADVSFVQRPYWFWVQFLSDLQLYEEHYDRMIVALGYKYVELQDLWLKWADRTFLFFRNDNLKLEKTAEFLSTHKNQIYGLIGANPNRHETRLAWMRLKKIEPTTPDLILDITKIAL